MTCLFWYCHTVLFHHGEETDIENDLFTQCSQAFGHIFRKLGSKRDVLMQVFPYTAAKTIFNMMYSWFSLSRGEQLTLPFRDSLVQLIFILMNGIHSTIWLH